MILNWLVNLFRPILDQYFFEKTNPFVQICTPFNVPTRASSKSAGYDIQADLFGLQSKYLDNAEIVRNDNGEIENVTIHPHGQMLIPTGIMTSFDDNYYVQIVPRSGLALKKRVTITNSPGTIEGDYHNEWGIILANESNQDVIIQQGDRVAQAIFSMFVTPIFVTVDSKEDFNGEDRGGGFGHSGK